MYTNGNEDFSGVHITTKGRDERIFEWGFEGDGLDVCDFHKLLFDPDGCMMFILSVFTLVPFSKKCNLAQ